MVWAWKKAVRYLKCVLLRGDEKHTVACNAGKEAAMASENPEMDEQENTADTEVEVAVLAENTGAEGQADTERHWRIRLEYVSGVVELLLGE